jgi:hypothetical protein
VFGLPGDRENIVRLNATHSDMCRFDDSQQDQDNFKLVANNLEELYEDALQKCESVRNMLLPGHSPVSADENLMSRLALLSPPT